MQASTEKPGLAGGVRVLLACFLLVLMGLALPVPFGPFPEQRGRFLVGLTLAGAGWLCALAWLARSPRAEELSARWVLLGAVALRVVLLLATPGLSDDAPRYVWEGGLVAGGISPYAHAPASPERAPQRAAWPEVYGAMNNRDISAAYPPAAQLGFALVTRLAGGPAEAARALLGMRLAFTLADLAVAALLVTALRRRGRPVGWALAWAWCPLVVLEFAGSGHFDSLGIALLLAALLTLERDDGRPESGARVLAGFALGAAAFLVKLLPIVLLPLAWLRTRRRVLAACAFLAACALLCLPLVLSEEGTRGWLTGLGAYATRWESFHLVFGFVDEPLARLGARLGGDGVLARPESRRVLSRALVGCAWLVVAWRVVRRRPQPLDAGLALFGAFVVLTPTLHPWYLAWPLAFLALRPSIAWAWLAAVAPLLYWPLTRWRAAGEWVEPAWLWFVVGLPFLLLLAYESRSTPVPAP